MSGPWLPSITFYICLPPCFGDDPFAFLRTFLCTFFPLLTPRLTTQRAIDNFPPHVPQYSVRWSSSSRAPNCNSKKMAPTGLRAPSALSALSVALLRQATRYIKLRACKKTVESARNWMSLVHHATVRSLCVAWHFANDTLLSCSTVQGERRARGSTRFRDRGLLPCMV